MAMTGITGDRLLQSLAADPQAMASVSAKVKQDPKAAIHEVAQQFEALFLNNLLKNMRETHFSDDERSSEMQTYKGLMDQQLVQSLTVGKGLGLSAILEAQISSLAKVGDPAGESAMPSPPVGNLPAMPRRALRAYGALSSQTGSAAGAAPTGDEAAAPISGVRQFVQSLLPAARQAASQLGVAPEMLVAHAALESGWGKRAIRNADGSNSFNLFGIKAGADWHGSTTQIMTTEYVNGVAQQKMDRFRAYGSYQQAFADYAGLLSGSSRYQGALNQGRNMQGFAQGLQSGGYATDPRYARKLVDVMSTLTQYLA